MTDTFEGGQDSLRRCPRRSRKQFTPECKREAVQLLESGSRPASAIARELGIARNQLYKWQTEFRARGAGAFPGSGARKERTTETVRLKRGPSPVDARWTR